MKKYLLIYLLFLSCYCAKAIDIYESYHFSPQELIGKTIIIPTYNGGNSTFHFVFNENALLTNDFSYHNFAECTILGNPITINDYRILNEGKKNESLCLIVTSNDKKVVLYFPMLIQDSDYDGKLLAELFYGESEKRLSSAALYRIDGINLKYYLADDVVRFEDRFKNKTVFMHGDDYISQKQYVFDGFAFFDKNREFSRQNKEWLYYPLVTWKGEMGKSHNYNLDYYYGILKGVEYTVYVKIKENGIKPTDEQCIALKAFDKLVVNESDFMQTFANQYDSKIMQVLNDTLCNREFFLPILNNAAQVRGLYSEQSDFSNYKVVSMQEIGNHYIKIDSIVQKKTTDNNNKVYYYYFALGHGTEMDVFDKYVGLPLNNKILKHLVNGKLHRELSIQAEQQRQRENKARLEEIEKEEQEYRNTLTKKYGAINARLIINGEVRIGFTKAMCKEVWGEPSYINNTITSYSRWEQWVYGIGSYLYFSGNKLVGIQN